jgi:hypothetical protein
VHICFSDIVVSQIGNKRLKVQHKQIRPSDNHRDNSPGFYGGGAVDGSFQRPPYGSHLPPSGAMAAQNMGSSPWLAQPPLPAVPIGEEGGASGQPGMCNTDNGAPNPPGVVDSDPSPNGPLSPLANLEPLRSALPDVAGSE